MNGEVSVSKQFVYVPLFAQEKAIKWVEGNQIDIQSPYIHFLSLHLKVRRVRDTITASQLSFGEGTTKSVLRCLAAGGKTRAGKTEHEQQQNGTQNDTVRAFTTLVRKGENAIANCWQNDRLEVENGMH